MKKSYVFIIFIILVLFLFPIYSCNSSKPNTDANGKYNDLIQIMNCPKDKAQYGEYYDYGYWGGGSWCNQQGAAGYWVWASPNWYIWKNKK